MPKLRGRRWVLSRDDRNETLVFTRCQTPSIFATRSILREDVSPKDGLRRVTVIARWNWDQKKFRSELRWIKEPFYPGPKSCFSFDLILQVNSSLRTLHTWTLLQEYQCLMLVSEFMVDVHCYLQTWTTRVSFPFWKTKSQKHDRLQFSAQKCRAAQRLRLSAASLKQCTQRRNATPGCSFCLQMCALRVSITSFVCDTGRTCLCFLRKKRYA